MALTRNEIAVIKRAAGNVRFLRGVMSLPFLAWGIVEKGRRRL